MQVRRAATVTGAVAALVLLGAPAWADESPSPDPSPVVIDDGGLEGDPACYFVPTPTDQPTGEVTAEPGESVTPEPGDGGTGESGSGETTEEPTGEPTDEPTVEPTLDPTDEPTVEPTVEPTDEPTGEPTDDPGGYYVCATPAIPGEGPLAGEASGGDTPTLGSGTATPQLPFSGAPVGHYAASGFALVLGGAGIVLVARRRTG
jgi:hypothetical protein